MNNGLCNSAWLRSEEAKVLMHAWVRDFKRASYISTSDLMTDALEALARILEGRDPLDASAGFNPQDRPDR